MKNTISLPAVSIEIINNAPFTPIGWGNDGKVRDKNGYVVADTDGHEGMAESIALLLNEAAWALKAD